MCRAYQCVCAYHATAADRAGAPPNTVSWRARMCRDTVVAGIAMRRDARPIDNGADRAADPVVSHMPKRKRNFAAKRKGRA